jgi:hypothetical protein
MQWLSLPEVSNVQATPLRPVQNDTASHMTASSPLRIAVLIDHVESDYHLEIISGVLRATRAAQVRTLVVAGGWLGTQEKPVTRNFIYGLLASRRLRVPDG